MENVEMSAKTREKEVRAKEILSEGFIPGVVYGHGCENISIQINKKEFTTILNSAGESSLINMKIDGKDFGNVVIKDYQTDPISDEVIHFDLHKVRMDEKITANVEVVLTGEAPAVKELGGVIVVGHDTIEIKCYPKDLLHEINIDLSVLVNLDDLIRVKDLNLPNTIEILNEEEDVLVSIVPPRTEAEVEELDEKPEESVDNVKDAKSGAENKEESDK